MTIRTTYATRAEAEADGWRSINRQTDRDVTEGLAMGYAFEAPDGQRSTQIIFTKEPNKMGWKGCCAQMFRRQDATNA
jgi:hypothetical protein